MMATSSGIFMPMLRQTPQRNLPRGSWTANIPTGLGSEVSQFCRDWHGSAKSSL